MLIIGTILFLSISSVLWYFASGFRQKNGVKYVDGPPGLPILGIALDFINISPKDVFNKVNELVSGWKGRCRANIGHHKILIVSIPQDIETIMTDQRFLSKSFEYEMMRPWLQDGLLTVGERVKWQSRRKALTPAFHFKILDEFVQVFDQQANVLTEILRKHSNKAAFNISQYISLYTLDVICETSMGVTVNAQTDSESEYVKAVKEISGIIFWRMHHFLARDNWYWNLTSQKRQHDQLTKKIHKFTESVIENRRQEKTRNDVNQNQDDEFGIKRRKALLDILLDSKINGETLSTRDIQEEVDNFMFAGHDTTTSAIEFMLFNLAKHPEIQKKVYDEIVEVMGPDSSEPVTLSRLNNLNYMDLVIKECLRLYPSVPFIARYLREDVEVNGAVYPADHSIIMAIYCMHRDPKIYPDPLTFRPERFLVQKSHDQMNAFSYTPFSGGYRNCIGQKFAQYEIKTVISKLLQNYQIDLISKDFEPVLTAEIILRPVEGIWLKFSDRK